MVLLAVSADYVGCAAAIAAAVNNVSCTAVASETADGVVGRLATFGDDVRFVDRRISAVRRPQHNATDSGRLARERTSCGPMVREIGGWEQTNVSQSNRISKK